MAPGEYEVCVTLDGYETPEIEHVTIVSEQTAKLHFMLKKDGTPVPEFPSAILPAMLIAGFPGAVLLIQRIRDQYCFPFSLKVTGHISDDRQGLRIMFFLL